MGNGISSLASYLDKLSCSHQLITCICITLTVLNILRTLLSNIFKLLALQTTIHLKKCLSNSLGKLLTYLIQFPKESHISHFKIRNAAIISLLKILTTHALIIFYP